jgi:uridine kinase
VKCKKQMADSSEHIEVTFPDGSSRNVPKGISLLELLKDRENILSTPMVAARVDNDIKELTYTIAKDCKVKFLDITDEDGMRIYRRSLHFILIKAVRDLFPERKVVIGHSISKGIFCEVNGSSELTEDEVKQIESRMRKLVDARIPFIKNELSREVAEQKLVSIGRSDRFHAVEHRNKEFVTIYSCDDVDDYFYGYMAPDTGYIKEFALKHYPPGLILMFPDRMNGCAMPKFKEQKKLFRIFREYKNWVRILGAENVGSLNDIIKSGKICELIRVSEALHEKKIAQIADMIAHSNTKKRVVLISGPSSSGKTSFAHRLSIQLRVNGLKPIMISLDDYFVDREQTPKDENGEYDYEALEAIDVRLFNQHLNDLINGLEIEMPVFNFPEGKREYNGKKLKINDDDILVIEGIHGLNERLTPSIPRKSKFKVYVSALTSMNIDDHNRIPTTDTRFIRRIVRDFQFRGSSAINTIKRWPSVRRGEEKNIFPFQEKADIMFNSSLIYELGVLKTLAEPLLAEIDASHPEYSEAKRLLEFLSYFLPIESREIPFNSILREFIGGSVFY